MALLVLATTTMSCIMALLWCKFSENIVSKLPLAGKGEFFICPSYTFFEKTLAFHAWMLYNISWIFIDEENNRP